METFNEDQKKLLVSLGLPTAFDGLNDDELIRIEDALADEMQNRGISAAGDGLNEHGELCRSCIIAMPD